MEANFEIKYREGLARIGTFTTTHGKVQTPTIMPVLDPLRPNQLPIDEITSLGAEMFITNAYLTFKNDSIRERALQESIHGLISYNGPIMTDSGAFQLMGYGKIDISNTEVTEFEEKIQVDIGVFLDIPVAMGTYEETKNALETTLERAKEHISARTDPQTMWAGPIQGGKYLDLITRSAQEMGSLPFDIHAIGSVVPLLESYEYATVAKMIFTAKQYLPLNRPVHLFGAGHPMVFALAVYLGIDLFDSAAYYLFAKAGRYMTVTGTYHLRDLEFFPCNCKFCIETSPKTIMTLKQQEQITFLARHNLAVSFGELKTIKQAVLDGRLWNLVLQRSASHPKLTEAVSFLISQEVQKFIEKFSSISYKSKLFAHPWAFSDPILLRYKERVQKRFPITRKQVVLVLEDSTVRIPVLYQKIFLHPLFGLVPEEWRIIYPVVQHVSFTKKFEKHTLIFINEWIQNNKQKYERIFNATGFDLGDLESFEVSEELPNNDESDNTNLKDQSIIKSVLKYQFDFDSKTLNSINEISVEKSKSDRIKDFYINFKRFGTIRASDSVIIPSEHLAKFLHESFPSPKHRVVVDSEVKEFIKEGKSVFAKFVKAMDENLRPGDECIIVSSDDDELIGFGQVLLNFKEIKYFTRGMVVKTRKGI